MTGLYLGLMSGTSIDAIDAVLVEIGRGSLTTHTTHAQPIPDDLRNRLLAICDPAQTSTIDELACLDAEVGEAFAEAALSLLEIAEVRSSDVRAIGSHGQTVRHRPKTAPRYTLQIGDPNRIAERTGITTVADFRRRDIAAGGQGAPLVPAFHAHALGSETEERVVLNIGGMANITVLPRDRSRAVTGFDTGPGNVLLDAWHGAQGRGRYDDGGGWAASGRVQPDLLDRLLAHPYFRESPPKSTGREDFGLAWLSRQLESWPVAVDPADVQATVLELTARTIADSIGTYAPASESIWVCGGGAHNRHLLRRLSALMPDWAFHSTAEVGLDPDWVEAIAFAWMAHRTLEGRPANEPAVTGASRPRILGGIYPA